MERPSPLKRRSLGRELALKYLFTVELGTENGMRGFEDFASHQEKDAETRAFAEVLVKGVLEHGYELRDLIEARATNWTWKRMPTVDRCLLLMGALELVHHDEIPNTVTINEIVELAKKFSTQASGGFVNGILDGLVPKKAPDPKTKTSGED